MSPGQEFGLLNLSGADFGQTGQLQHGCSGWGGPRRTETRCNATTGAAFLCLEIQANGHFNKGMGDV